MTNHVEKRPEEHSSCNWITALILVLAGVVLLLNNFGLVPWTFWNGLWKFWPVVIILWGLELMTGKNFLGKAFVIVTSILIILFVFAYSLARVNPRFDRWLQNTFPKWTEIKKEIPQNNDDESLLPFDLKNGRKIFRCDPATGECKAIYK